ncbi:hypothetical protein KSF78_0009522 [Schistosoma japonicum]|nr:hypothetical protein KSF78_0009522 [Schistosoma japonicum]
MIFQLVLIFRGITIKQATSLVIRSSR